MRQNNIRQRYATLALYVTMLAVALGGCAPLPGESQMTKAQRDAPYPKLVPLAEIEAKAAALRGESPASGASTLSPGAQGSVAAAPIGPDTAKGLDSRGATLRARAARLRGNVIDQNTQKRMDQGVTPIPDSEPDGSSASQ